MGNSEVGHQNIGAGRIVDQESVAITKAVRTGTFFDNAQVSAAIHNALQKGTALHLFGIVSDAGVQRAARASVRSSRSVQAQGAEPGFPSCLYRWTGYPRPIPASDTSGRSKRR